MSRVYGDNPIDNATHFNFDIYADSIAEIILNKENETPFTIAINGKWGSGKTTLMKTLRSKLDSSTPDEKTRKVKTVWFDAWKYKECDSMLASLVSEILEEMERKGFLNKIKSKTAFGIEKVDQRKVIIDLAKSLTIPLKPYLHPISTMVDGPEFEKWLRQPKYQNKLSFYDCFQGYMDKILKTFVLEKQNGKYTDEEGILVIFIDDLDRCPPSNITNILESVNLFLDQRGCFFVIGADISIISKSIDAQYQLIKDFSGIEYIRKMIQLNFDLPMLKEDDIVDFMRNQLKIDSELEPYLDIITKGLKSNQREIIRFLNSLTLMRILGKSLRGYPGYDEELLIKWNILSFSSVTFVEEIKKNPTILFSLQHIAITNFDNRDAYIESLKNEEFKKRCRGHCENDQIINVLSRGDKLFDKNNIDTYLFLSSIAPKELNLEGADHQILIKPGANLMDADLMRANLLEANLEKAILKRTFLMEAHLERANLKEANLEGANLMKANMEDAILEGTNLKKANMLGTNCENAIFERAILREANLTGANMEGANMLSVDMKWSILDRTNLIDAIFNEFTLETILQSHDWILAYFNEDTRKKLEKMSKK